MKKLITAFGLLISFSLSAQTIFHYGNDSVSVQEFLKAYNKNKTNVRSEKAFRDYLNLYIASRLKIKEAREKGYDTLPQIVSDLDNLRQQILPNYLTDKESVNKLVDEAYSRSQKDIHLAHIFINFQQNGMFDTVAALKKLADVQDKLKTGVDFSAVAKQYSDDPSAKENGGDLDWITVFSLPYALENLAYSTPVGKVSSVYKSKAGYHIFKNLAERKDPGRINANQILIAFPPGADASVKEASKKLADSIYNRLLKGDDFGKLASQFSNDVISAAANGQMIEFGVGEYDPVFENTVYSLQKNVVSKPFLTSHGYHIVKLVGKTPAASKTDTKAMEILRSKVEQSDRIASTKIALANKILKEAGYKKAAFNSLELWAFSDSILNYQKPNIPVHVTGTDDLIQIGDKKFLVSDWITYAQTFRYKPDGSGIKPYSQLWDEFVEAMALNYYQANLENYNEEFKDQIKEFEDGNLFFEIMQREVWGPAQSDSAALANYFEKNRSKYNWKPSVDAVIFYASDMATAKTFVNELKKSPSSWHDLVSKYEEKIAADSSRFELAQIPNPAKQTLQPGTVTSSLLNKADNTASFAYIIRNHNNVEPRSFDDARGLVINDYQIELEKNWVEQLKKKYPVVVNEKVLNSLIKEKKY
ncbi:MAG TPA: peptidylprolyl isomerase [Flavisolibacter sp.]|nr:peptidylprolyl isomerase [Flavisolibacter sp.]